MMAVGSRNLRPWSWPKQALFAAAFLLFSHLFYHDVILIWVIKAAACLLVVYVVIRTILRLTGKMEWDPVGGGGIITSTLFSATVVLFAGPVVLAITVGTMSVGAAFVRAMVEVPWSELSILSTFGVVAAAFMGLFAQRFLVLAFIEDPEQFQEAYLGIPLSFLVTHIAVGFAGFVVFPITIGAFLAGVFGLFFMPLFLSIGVVRAIVLSGTPVMDTTCALIARATILTRPEDWVGIVWWVAQRAWEAFNFIGKDEQVYELLMGRQLADDWYDTGWQGTINLATAVVGGLGLATCAI